MQAEFLKPFIDSTVNVLGTMCQVAAVPDEPKLKDGSKTWGDLSGVIGMGGSTTSGNMVISFEKATIVAVVNRMLQEQFVDLTPDVVDAVGEITNMICGGAKRGLAELGLQINMASPLMIMGQGVQIAQLSRSPVVQVIFNTEYGRFALEANLAVD